MPENLSSRNVSALEAVRSRLRLLNALNGFVVVLLAAILTASLYAPLGSVLGDLPRASVAVIIALVGILVMAGFYLSFLLTRQVRGIMEEHSGRLDRILRFTHEIREEVHGDILYETIAESAKVLTDSEACLVHQREDGALEVRAARGAGLESLVGKKVPVDTGLPGWVAAQGEPLHMADVPKSPGFGPSLQGLTSYEVRTSLCVPLRTRSGVLGVIELLNNHGGHYDERDVELGSYLAEQAAISVERAQFYENHKNYRIHLTDMLIEVIDHMVPEQAGHSRRVASYAGVLAKAVDMTEEEQRRLHFAGLLHDVGYLKALGEATFRQWAEATHARAGHEMLSNINIYREVAPLVLHHHDRYDGEGNSDGIEGADIPLEGRILALAEAFDAAMIGASQRGLASGQAFEAAVTELGELAGAALDPALVDIFVNSVREKLD
ncbi:MAG: GAF domain-containing protein [Nitrospirota bacterium]|jgi:hypothetical protein